MHRTDETSADIIPNTFLEKAVSNVVDVTEALRAPDWGFISYILYNDFKLETVAIFPRN